MPSKLANSVLVALIPSSLSQHQLTTGQTAAMSRAIGEALGTLKNQGLVALTCWMPGAPSGY